MAISVLARCSLLLVSVAEFVDAAAFLTARSQVARDDVKQFLLSELSGHNNALRMSSIEEELRPMYTALPKMETGRLEASTVRYALHRYFVQKHGWYVKGLDNTGSTFNSYMPTTVLKARAPAYIQSLFEGHLHGIGLGLHELAVFAATLSDLIHAEAVGELEWIYAALGLPFDSPVTPDEADLAIKYFLIAYLDFSSMVANNRHELEEMEQRVVGFYPDFPETSLWLQDLRNTYDLQQLSRHNPFVERVTSFDDSVAFALEAGHSFGSFQNLECHALKSKLVDMEYMGTGRVLLSEFYSRALAGDWQFMESVEYLRNQGALDETDPNRPSVVIPNYVNSPTNCLTGSDFYAICCVNECEGLMGRLERQLAAPSATPTRIAEVVSSLHSDTVDAPRNLSAALLTRLDEVARFHSGPIPLHGRLFAQWMHHAYPRECLFPHVAGTTSPLSQEEFVDQVGGLQVSEDEMKTHALRVNLTFGAPEALPWTSDEELIAEHKQTRGATRSLGLGFVQGLAALAALVSFAVPLLRTCMHAKASSSESKIEKCFV